MKVCHVTSSHKRYDGRIFEKECVSLSKKYEVTLLCADDKPNEEKCNINIKSINIKKKNRLNRFIIIPKKMKKFCIKEEADIYHFHDPELISLANFMKKKGKIVVFDSHEDNVSRISNRHWIPKCFRGFVKYLYAKKEKRIFKKLDSIITVNEHIYKRLYSINKNIYIITNYPIIDNNKISKLKNNSILCFAGGISSQYMHHNIIKAISKLPVRYKLAGPSFDNYLESLKQIKGYNKVDYIGVLNKEELSKLYLNSGIGMVLINYVPNINFKKGSLGITKIFEYMSYGLPVIATDLECWDFVDKNCGICVNPNDVNAVRKAIEYLINNPKEARQMGKNGRKLVEEKYNWETQEKELYKLYKKLEEKYEKNCNDIRC